MTLHKLAGTLETDKDGKRIIGKFVDPSGKSHRLVIDCATEIPRFRSTDAVATYENDAIINGTASCTLGATSIGIALPQHCTIAGTHTPPTESLTFTAQASWQ